MERNVPKLGDWWEYEAAPFSDEPRWQLKITPVSSVVWHDAGGSQRWVKCQVTEISGTWAVFKNEAGDRFSIPYAPGPESYRPDQWEFFGFFRPFGAIAKATEEECPGCKRMKDVGRTCWCCGGGSPHLTRLGVDKRRSRY